VQHDRNHVGKEFAWMCNLCKVFRCGDLQKTGLTSDKERNIKNGPFVSPCTCQIDSSRYKASRIVDLWKRGGLCQVETGAMHGGRWQCSGHSIGNWHRRWSMVWRAKMSPAVH